MAHYFFFKYWSRGLVVFMVSLVVGYVGVFSYALSTGGSDTSAGSELKNLEQAQKTYIKSANVFEKIQDLKLKKQDTSKLETLYSASVKNLSNQNQKQAEIQLFELESQIAVINEKLVITPTPRPMLTETTLSGTPSPSNPQPTVADTQTDPKNPSISSSSAEIN